MSDELARALHLAGLAGPAERDVLVVSARRDLRRAVNACRAHRAVAVRTGQGAGPGELARALAPAAPRSFVVFEDLGGPAERMVRCRPAEATSLPFTDPSLVLVLAGREPPPEPGSWLVGRPESPARWAFPGPSPTVAYTLALLGPGLGDLVWDVGSPAAAIAVASARFGAAAVAVAPAAGAAAQVRAAVRDAGVLVQVAQGPVALLADHLPVPDAVLLTAPNPDDLAACADRALRTVVATTRDPAAVPDLRQALVDTGRAPRVTHLRAAAAVSEDVHLVWARD